MVRDNWGTVAEAAEALGVTKARIYQLLKKNALGQTKEQSTPWGTAILIRKPFTRRPLPTGIRHDSRAYRRYEKELKKRVRAERGATLVKENSSG